jgi:sulfite reductase (NADPH) flavoprotein alpha-component
MMREQMVPLTEQQTELLLQLVDGISAEQLTWVKGYLAGVSAAVRRAETTPALPATAAAEPSRITILYGSQTGHAAAVAEAAKSKAVAAGFKVDLYAMGDYKPARLKNEKLLLIAVSTQGEGEPPDEALELHEFIHGGSAPRLEDTRYAVLALGDSSYAQFCKCGRDFDEKLAALGAQPLRPRVDCDVDFETDAEAWVADVVRLATETQAPATATEVRLAPTATTLQKAATWSRSKPFAATLIENIKLSGRGSAKEVRHIELSLEGSGIHYEPGDSLGVVPQNDPELVAELIAALDLDSGETVALKHGTATLEQALTREYEITTLSRPFLTKYAALADAGELDKLLLPENESALRSFMDGREVIDVIIRFPASGISGAEFMQTLRRLQPRLYSIASSGKVNPGMAHLTVAAVRYATHGRNRKGVASMQFSERITAGDQVPVYVEHNRNFKLPADTAAPVIMIGPGTGVAPFRAFIEEREAVGATGDNWLFFGDQHFRTDFLYQREWQRYLKNSVLNRIDVAFSRDGRSKTYVQHRMLERSRDLYAWLQDGAHLYVCGDADHMARDVHATLTGIVQSEAGCSAEAATEYVRNLQREKRYQRDVY